jgi:hypothetical protein
MGEVSFRTPPRVKMRAVDVNRAVTLGGRDCLHDRCRGEGDITFAPVFPEKSTRVGPDFAGFLFPKFPK